MPPRRLRPRLCLRFCQYLGPCSMARLRRNFRYKVTGNWSRCRERDELEREHFGFTLQFIFRTSR